MPSFPVPGVLDPSVYVLIRAEPVLGDALDNAILPALSSNLPTIDRVQAAIRAHDDAVVEWTRAQQDGRIPAGPPVEGPASNAVLAQFDRVCTDAVRSWLRTEAERVATGPGTIDTRREVLETLAEQAATAIPWDPPAGATARQEIRNRARVMAESAAAP